MHEILNHKSKNNLNLEIVHEIEYVLGSVGAQSPKIHFRFGSKISESSIRDTIYSAFANLLNGSKYRFSNLLKTTCFGTLKAFDFTD